MRCCCAKNDEDDLKKERSTKTGEKRVVPIISSSGGSPHRSTFIVDVQAAPSASSSTTGPQQGRDHHSSTVMWIDFDQSICSTLLGREAHRKFIRCLRRHRYLVKLSAVTYNVGMCTVGAMCFVKDETYSSVILTIAAFAAVLPAYIQMGLSINPTLLRNVPRSSSYWTSVISQQLVWIVVATMLGGLRGVLYFILGLLATGIGCSTDSFHFRFRSNQGSFWGFVTSLVLGIVFTSAAVLLPPPSGKELIVWSIGSRQITSQDIIVNAMGTFAMFLFHQIYLSSLSSKWLQRFLSNKQPPSPRSDWRRISCPSLQWPLVLQPVHTNNERPPADTTSQVGKSPARSFLVPLTVSRPTDIFFQSNHTLSDCFREMQWSWKQRYQTTCSTTERTHPLRVSQKLLSPFFFQLLMFLETACVIPISFYLGTVKKFSSLDQLLWISPLVAATSLMGSIGFCICLSMAWNADLLRLILRSSVDFWFLVVQVGALAMSLCDAVAYDERSLAILSWCILYVTCLLSDAQLPHAAGDRSMITSTKAIIGLAAFLPLLVTQCVLVYSLFFLEDSLHLQFRTLIQITHHQDDEVVDMPRAIMSFSTDSFIIARQSSVTLFSLPVLYHLAVRCASSDGSVLPVVGPSATSYSDSVTNNREQHLYLLTGKASYRVPRSTLPSLPVNDKSSATVSCPKAP